MAQYGSTPDRDASLGLIFRMNDLWQAVDDPARKGEYDEWNNYLDRIFANLDYKVDWEVKRDKDGNLIDVDMENEHKEIFDFLSAQVSKYKKEARTAKNSKLAMAARGKWYKALLKKDRWLRKLMMKLQLYLKETEHTPGSALFGSFGKK